MAVFCQDAPKDTSQPQNPSTENSQADASVPKSGLIRVGDNFAAATLIHQVTPVYPKKAKKQHIQGTVLLHAIITKAGTIRTLEYANRPPELSDSAMDEVKKWRYKPTMINGKPVEVDIKISVVFALGND